MATRLSGQTYVADPLRTYFFSFDHLVGTADCLYLWRTFESMWAELNMASRHVDVNERRLRPVYGIGFSILPLEKS